MRNLKKVLSLALAMVMLLGMMVVGAGAATKYADDEKIVNKEAVTVVSAIGVLQGVGEGKFNPEGTLTRAEAAVVIAKLDLGADAASALTATNAATFNDVGVGYGWAKAYIDYCAGSGYIVGDGNGNFLPAKTVTSVEFATMVCRMLGYRDKNEGLTGPDWVIKATALARKAGLSTNVVMNSVEGMTRDDMAQMAYNALTAPMVEYEGMDITIGDVAINSKAKVRVHDVTLEGQTADTTYTNTPATATTPIRLCEEKFPTLKLSRQDEIDHFGRRCSVWKYKGLKIAGSEGTIAPDLAYNTKVTKDIVADWAKMEGLKASPKGVDLWINGFYKEGKPVVDDKGTADTSDDKTYAPGTDNWIAWYTGAGREVEVYLNKDNLREVERVVVVDTVLGTVTKVNSDGTVAVKLEKTKNKVADGTRILVAAADAHDEVKANDVVLVQGYGAEIIGKDTTISSVVVAPQVDGFVNIKRYSNQLKASVLVIDGTEYPDAYSVVRDYDVDAFNVNTKYDSTLILDNHGNIMKALEGEAANAVTDKLIAVKRMYNTLSGGELVPMVEGVLSNGETVRWPVTDSTNVAKNTICQWTKDGSKYDVTPVVDRPYSAYSKDWNGDTTSKKTNAGKTYSTHVANTNAGEIVFKANDVFGKKDASNVMYSNNVKFIFVDPSANGDVTVLSGRQNYTLKALANVKNIVAQAMKGNEITAVFINVEPDVVDISDLIYVHSRYRLTDEVVTLDDGSRVKYYGYKAYTAAGEEIEGFLGQSEDMWGTFLKAEKTDDGKAYKDTSNKTAVKEHTMVNGVVAMANGLAGDALVLVDTDTNTHYDFMGRKSTTVKDLTTEKYGIDSIAYLNEIVKDGNYVEAAVIFNATDAEAQVPSEGNVREAVTVFVTKISSAKADVDKIPSHEVGKPLPSAITINWAGTAVKGTDFDVKESLNNLKKGDTLTIEAKDGAELTITGDSNCTVKDNVVTITVAKGEVKITVDKKGGTPVTPTTGKITLDEALEDKNVGTIKGDKITQLGNGTTTATFTLEKPDWAYALGTANDDVEVNYVIYVGGKQWTTERSTTLKNTPYVSATPTSNTDLMSNDTAANRDKITEYTITNLVITDDSDTDGKITPTDALKGDVTIKITSVKWKNAAVEYVDNNGKTLNMDSTSTKYLSTTTPGPLTIKVSADAFSGKYTIGGIVTTGLDAETYKDVEVSDFATGTTSESFKANGGEKVKVTITPDDKITEKLNLVLSSAKIDSSNNDTIGTANFSLNNRLGMPKKPLDYVNASVENFGKMTVTTVVNAADDNTDKAVDSSKGTFDVKVAIAADTNPTKVVAGYKVTMKNVDGATLVGSTTKTIAATGGNVSFTFEKMTKDVTISAANFTVEPVYMLHAVKTEISGRTITVTFSEDTIVANAALTVGTQVKLGTSAGDGTNNTKITDMAVEGNQLILTLAQNATLADDEVLTIVEDTFKVTSSDAAPKNAQAAITIKVPTGGEPTAQKPVLSHT